MTAQVSAAKRVTFLTFILKTPSLTVLKSRHQDLNRPLSKALDYERFMGRQARIRTRHPIEGRKNFKGALAGISAGVVKLSVEGTIVSIPFGEIARAQLVEQH